MKITPWSNAKIEFDDARHLYLVNGQPKSGPSQLLGMVGLSPKVDDMPEPMRSNFINAGNLGKVVHKWCEILDLGQYEEYEPPKDKELAYLNAWFLFKNENNPYIIEIEQPHYSEYGDYCGIPDRICQINGELYVLDIKSSKSINPNGRLQTLAYTYFFKEPLKRMIVQLKNDGSYQIYDNGTLGKMFMDDAEDAESWKAVLTVAKLIRNKR